MPSPVSSDLVDFNTLAVRMLQSTDLLARRLRSRLVEEIEGYRLVDPDNVVAELAVNIRVVLTSCLPDAPPPPEEALADAEIRGADRERLGVPLEDVLRGWRIGFELAFDHARTLAHELDLRSEPVLDYTRMLLRAFDLYTSAIATGHRRAELDMAVVSNERQNRLVRQLLLHDGSAADSLKHLKALGLDSYGQWQAFCTENLNDDTRTAVNRWIQPSHPSGTPAGVASVVDQHVIGFLARTPPKPPALIALGAEVTREELPESLRQAQRVHNAARAAGWSRGVVTIDDLGIRVAVHDDRDVSEVMLRRYIDPVTQTRSGAAVLETVWHYFNAGQQVDRTAEAMFVHANTVRYRLRRFEELTATDLRDGWVIANVVWALIRQNPTLRPGLDR
ncbi:PucR family transcriptional regulator [Streptomyces sp. NBC_01530]|uniref:PucR family transcriptional regulator n=1 Tax=Streptomyces sp. NBC_01530 TaxID=2903895 RepID=UPI003869FFCC